MADASRMANTRSLLAQLRAAEKAHGSFESIELLIPDLSGVLRGKRIRRSDFEKCAEGGFVFCAGATLLNTLGEVTTGVPYGADDGDPDLPARLIPGSIVPVPWASKRMGQAFFRIVNEDGGDFFGDSRTVLENALKPLKKRGIKPVVATELEFYLLDGKREDYRAGAPKVPGSSTTSTTGARRRACPPRLLSPNTRRGSSKSTCTTSTMLSSRATTP